jgi:hypothetical protein
VTVSANVPMTVSYGRLQVAHPLFMGGIRVLRALDLARRVLSRNRITFVNSFCLKVLEARQAGQVISRRSYVNARNRL